MDVSSRFLKKNITMDRDEAGSRKVLDAPIHVIKNKYFYMISSRVKSLHFILAFLDIFQWEKSSVDDGGQMG